MSTCPRCKSIEILNLLYSDLCCNCGKEFNFNKQKKFEIEIEFIKRQLANENFRHDQKVRSLEFKLSVILNKLERLKNENKKTA